MSQVDVDSGIENMEVDESDRREKRSLSDKVSKEETSLGSPSGICRSAGCHRSERLSVCLSVWVGFSF